MAVFYTKNLQKHISEVNYELSRPAEKIYQRNYKEHLRKGRLDADYEKKFTYDTSKFAADADNRNNLVKSVIPMVIRLATELAKKCPNRVELEDVIQAGYIGAMTAADRYIANEPNNTAKFSTFSYDWIKKYISEYCWKTTSILSAKLSSYRNAIKLHVRSGDEPIGEEDSRKTTTFDYLQSDNVADPESIDSAAMSEFSEKLFEKLTAEEKKILFMSFGIGLKAPISVQEIAKYFKCSAGKIHRSIKKSIEKCYSKELKQFFLEFDSTNIITQEAWKIM